LKNAPTGFAGGAFFAFSTVFHSVRDRPRSMVSHVFRLVLPPPAPRRLPPFIWPLERPIWWSIVLKAFRFGLSG
jgi:hypothetical protein